MDGVHREREREEEVGVDGEAKQIKRREGKRRILPLDLTIEILSCLPAKSLVRLGRVCKLWHSITQDPHFIQTNLGKIRARAPTLLLFPYYVYCLIDHNFTITRLDCCDDHLNPKTVIRDVLLYASCNGLLCLSDSGTTLVANPATGQSLTLPPSGPLEAPITPYFGFGFEHAAKEYKVVCIFTDDKDTPVCQVFTLGTDSAWRRIHSSLDFRTFRHYGVAVQGAIYWQTSLSPWQGRDRDDQALRFDLKQECFDRITLPTFENFYRGKNFLVGKNFTELQGNLCLPIFPNITSASSVMPRMDIWVMNAKHQWSMSYSIMFPWDHRRPPEPLLICNDKILVHDYQHGTRLRYHHLHPAKNATNNEVYHHDEDIYRVPFVHVESLVPLPSPN